MGTGYGEKVVSFLYEEQAGEEGGRVSFAERGGGLLTTPDGDASME